MHNFLLKEMLERFDENKILNKKLIISIEEHNIIGGLGSAISEYKSTLGGGPKQIFIGVNDQYSKGGSYSYLKNKNGLSAEKIVTTVLQNYRSL